MRDQDHESSIFAELYPPLRRFAAVVGPLEVDPDDLVQEAVVRTLRHHRLDELDHPGAYLRRTIVHLASNERRGFATRRRAMARLAPDATARRDEYPSDIADLSAIPPQERAALYLSEIEGHHYDEIGRLLDCSEAAARKRAMRARRRLADTITEEVRHG